MATNKYIMGLSGAGFRVPDNTGALKRVKENVIVQVNLDDEKTKKILVGEKDNFIRVAASNSTTATIIGLTRYGFRIPNSVGAIVTVKLGSGVHTIDLTNANARRILRRTYGRWLRSTSATSATIRGIVAQQAGFQLGDDTSEATINLTGSNAGNATNGSTVQVGTDTYTIKTNLTEAKATGTITTSGTGAANNDTVTVAGVTYTFKTSLTGAANEVLRDGTEDHDLTNLKAAINGEAGAGSTYGTGTVANPNVTCGAVTSHAVTITAKSIGTAGNALTLTKTGSVLTVSGSGTLAGGANSVANEIKIAGTADGTLTNLVEAINGGSNAGTDYSTATVANPKATAAGPTSHVVTITAAGDIAPADITVATNEPTYTFDAQWGGGGVVIVYEGVSATVNPQKPAIYTQLRRHFKSYVEA